MLTVNPWTIRLSDFATWTWSDSMSAQAYPSGATQPHRNLYGGWNRFAIVCPGQSSQQMVAIWRPYVLRLYVEIISFGKRLEMGCERLPNSLICIHHGKVTVLWATLSIGCRLVPGSILLFGGRQWLLPSCVWLSFRFRSFGSREPFEYWFDLLMPF
jgi:hypothetical protein